MKSVMVSKYLLKIVARQVGELKSGLVEGSSEWEKNEGISEKLSMMLNCCVEVPLEMIPGVSKGDLMEHLGLKRNVDASLPVDMVRRVQEKMGYNMVPDFVMYCGTIWMPIPITAIGRAMLPVIYKVVFEQEVPVNYMEIAKTGKDSSWSHDVGVK